MVDRLISFDLMSCLNESPSEKEGKSLVRINRGRDMGGLNESPSEKEGKF